MRTRRRRRRWCTIQQLVDEFLQRLQFLLVWNQVELVDEIHVVFEAPMRARARLVSDYNSMG